MTKKICIVHDSFLYIGGAEKVLFKLIEKYPDADIFIPIARENYLELIRNKSKGNVRSNMLGKFPYIEIIASFLKPFLIFYWETLNLTNYDLVISSSHSFSSKSVNKAKEARHVSYIHTPPKYLYDEFNQMSWIKKYPFKIILWPIMFLLRKYDYYSAQKPDLLIANSENVQKRIKKYYNRDSKVVYPVENTVPINSVKKKPKYFIFFSRLEKQKGAELVIKTCTKYNIPLVVIGTGSLERYLKEIAGKTIFFTGFISEEQKHQIFLHAKALIYASIDEDFGMVIPEVLSQNIPVIAYDSGAIREFKTNNKIYLFNQFSVKALRKAINKYYSIHKKEVQS